MAALYLYAADQGMPVELKFSSVVTLPLVDDGAACRIRTGDPLITNEMLYQLS